MTDENGHFNIADIENIAGNDTIIFSYVGYLSLKLTLKDLRYSSYRVIMFTYSQQLPEVSVKGERGRIFLSYEPLKDLPVAVVSSGSFFQMVRYISYQEMKRLWQPVVLFLIKCMFMTLLQIFGQKVCKSLPDVMGIEHIIIKEGYS